MNYPGPPGRAPDQSNTKLRSRQPISRRQKTVSLIYTTPQSQTTPYPNQNQSSFSIVCKVQTLFLVMFLVIVVTFMIVRTDFAGTLILKQTDLLLTNWLTRKLDYCKLTSLGIGLIHLFICLTGLKYY
ncbi:MAG: hypothetical protein EZS28_025884 [Streblomastix strix]|uniref:Uncharacterized protein n=1 Tax=Streblomastix strix TaxID=222440 RepID=A0A5J4V709_9EUKA|nr:MAG: hypothetical protein EZS28_025884 [Streblomastix strix]